MKSTFPGESAPMMTLGRTMPPIESPNAKQLPTQRPAYAGLTAGASRK